MTASKAVAGARGPRQAGGSPFGPGPFMDDLHRTPAVLWVAVLLMCFGVALVGGAVIALMSNVD
jgi:hypothetical protein